MEEVAVKSQYELYKHNFLKYQKNRLETDPEFRQGYYDRRSAELKEKYKNDPEYRELVKERTRKYREIKKQQKLLMV